MFDMMRWSFCFSVKNYIERIQKRCFKICFAKISNADALFESGLERFSLRCNTSVRNFFRDILHQNSRQKRREPGHPRSYM
jgi:hypothetical protein